MAFPILKEILDQVGRCSNLRLNFDKCIIIPLWLSGCEDVRGFLACLEGNWSLLQVDFKGIYLGF